MKQFTMSGLRRPIPLALLVVVAVGLGLSACGSSARARRERRTAASTGAAARLNLAKCFRSHGINVPDPSTGGGPAGGGSLFRVLRNTPRRRSPQLARPAAVLRPGVPAANISPAQRAQLQQQLVKFAQCMRSHGVKVPDPTFNNNGSGGGPGAGFGFRGGFNSPSATARRSKRRPRRARACVRDLAVAGRALAGGAGGGAPPGAGPRVTRMPRSPGAACSPPLGAIAAVAVAVVIVLASGLTGSTRRRGDPPRRRARRPCSGVT